jgi:G3E family GTPase
LNTASKTNLVVIGGFLGSGKTTSILNMARYLVSQGKRIGIVTNDQGSQLVDTQFLVQAGLPVLEVTGGCFCCNFDQFTEKLNQLATSQLPDYILAEPVGSCTDLIATIFKPLKAKYTQQFSLSQLSILADPKRVKKLMMEPESSPFPDEINYLFRKQLEEADVIVLNKVDLLNQMEVTAIHSFLKNTFKGIAVITTSAKNNEGIAEWAEMVTSRHASLNSSLEIDYKTYATAEAYLGWLNSSGLLEASAPVDLNTLVYELLENLKAQLQVHHYEIAHLKVYGVAESDWVKASVTSIMEKVDFNHRMEQLTKQAKLIINARIHIDPETLKPLVEEALSTATAKHHINVKNIRTECFKPGKPEPKYRIA